MPTPLASLLVWFILVYAGLGALFAGPFVAKGVEVIDPMARGASWGFRLLILPGSMLLWPLLLKRWAGGSVSPPVETNAHRRGARRAA